MVPISSVEQMASTPRLVCHPDIQFLPAHPGEYPELAQEPQPQNLHLAPRVPRSSTQKYPGAVQFVLSLHLARSGRVAIVYGCLFHGLYLRKRNTTDRQVQDKVHQRKEMNLSQNYW